MAWISRYSVASLAVLMLLSGAPAASYDDLYPEHTKNVVYLTRDTFNQQIFNSNYTWVVTFYAVWCGHCRRFAEPFKQFASNIEDGQWNKFIKVGVLPCSSHENSAICRKQKITGYPSIKVFRAYRGENQGVKVMNHGSFLLKYNDITTVQRLKTQTANELKTYMEDGNNKKVDYSVFNDIANGEPPLICENKSTIFTSIRLIAILAILDDPCVRFSFSYRFDEFRDINQDGRVSVMKLKNPQSYTEVMRHEVGVLLTKSAHPVTRKPSIQLTTTKRPDAVYTTPLPPSDLDLQSAIRYSLFQEVLTQRLDRRHAVTLKLWLATLKNFYLGPYHARLYLMNLYDLLRKQKTGLSQLLWKKMLNKAETPTAYLDDPGKKGHDIWSSCKGSREDFRGYPCAMWSTLHYVTVNRLEHPVLEESFNARKLAFVYSRYIRDFFGCRECARNFNKRAKSTIKKEINKHSLTDVILWLWRSHNRANKALKGQLSEDPLHAKIQFPNSELCDDCKDGNGQWNDLNVLKFLITFYKASKDGKDCVYSEWSACKVPGSDQECGLGRSQRTLVDLNTTESKAVMEIKYIKINNNGHVKRIYEISDRRCGGQELVQERFCLRGRCSGQTGNPGTSDVNTVAGGATHDPVTYKGILSNTNITEYRVCYPLESIQRTLTCDTSSSQRGWVFTRAVCGLGRGYFPSSGYYLVNKRGARKWRTRNGEGAGGGGAGGRVAGEGGKRMSPRNGEDRRKLRLDSKFSASQKRTRPSRKQLDYIAMVNNCKNRRTSDENCAIKLDEAKHLYVAVHIQEGCQ